MLDSTLDCKSFRLSGDLGIHPVRQFLPVGDQRRSTRTIRGKSAYIQSLGNRMVGDRLARHNRRSCRYWDTSANLYLGDNRNSPSVETTKLVRSNFRLNFYDSFGSPRIVSGRECVHKSLIDTLFGLIEIHRVKSFGLILGNLETPENLQCY